MPAKWGGRRAVFEREWLAQFLPAPCVKCGTMIDPDVHEWDVDHTENRDMSPELTWDRLNMAPAHAKCNRRAGAKYRNWKHRRPSARKPGEPEPDLPPPPEKIDVEWEDVADWGQAPPRYFSTPHPKAAGTYVEEYDRACEQLRIEPRLWQRTTAERALEHDENGDLCWPMVFASASRQSGKSTGLLRPLAVTRANLGLEWGEAQFITHVARVRAAATKLVRRPEAIKIAERLGLEVRKSNGEEGWIWPEGSIWQVFATAGAYGETSSQLMIDEGWDIKPGDFWDGLQPTVAEAFRPQIWFISAAHANTTDLMLERRAAAIGDDNSIMVSEWSADPDDDPYDPRTWWSASAHWSPGRFEAMKAAYRQRSFREQYLNIWPQRDVDANIKPGQLARWISAPTLTGPPPAGLVGAVEMDGDGTSYGLSVVEWGDTAKAWTLTAATLQEAEHILRDWQVSYVLVGASFAGRCSLPVQPATSQMIRESLPELRRRIDEGTIVRNDDAKVDDQFRRARIVPLETGPTLSARQSKGPIAAVKATVWAARAAREYAEHKSEIW